MLQYSDICYDIPFYHDLYLLRIIFRLLFPYILNRIDIDQEPFSLVFNYSKELSV